MLPDQRKNIFVIGMDEANLRTLEAVPNADEYRLHQLFSIEELQEEAITVDGLMSRARAVLDSHEGSIDAIVGYWDFPVSTLVPMLSREYGTTSTSLASVVKCEHKYWSRLEQQKVIDEHPRFGMVDLESSDPQPPEGVSFPMWLKPALSYSSELAFGVNDMTEFRSAVTEIRGGIARVGEPFEAVLDLVELPPEMAGVGGRVCLAEETMTGIQVAVEGYVHDGEVTVYGVLDSINYPNSSSFLRHQYPSTLPAPVIQQLHDVSARTMRQIGMESATFSIEYFYDPKTGGISLLEINPRHSQSHAELFEFVDGVANHHRMFSLALGRDPALQPGLGDYQVSAKWYYRWFGEGRVHQVPTADEIAAIEREIPGVRIDMVPAEGQRLSTVGGQDSYSYEIAHIFTGGKDEGDLRHKFDRCIAALGLTFDETEPGERGRNTA
ncbi:acetyl-CoA carboxylase biotin carboxylase subunit family protein [Streptomyces sp. NPDC091416]|uniref:ATP-grasp domain-containing protein n=1 Tax=Streptomyces sp. NPDC091416 TaxID=3366003 RepID=UPI00380F6CD8